MFARGRSTRGQMKSPSIAQRGEGGVRGGSGELDPTVKRKPEAERDACKAGVCLWLMMKMGRSPYRFSARSYKKSSK